MERLFPAIVVILTLVYEDWAPGTENVDVYRTPFRDHWQEAEKTGADMTLLCR